MNHDSLSTLLHRWRHEPRPAADFAAGVWARIDAARSDERVVRAFRWALPLAASVAIILGFSAARLEARQQHAERMADSYVRTIDPIHMADEVAPTP